MDLQGSWLTPDEVDILLASSPESLHTLCVCCIVITPTKTRPSLQSWPRRTVMDMTVNSGHLTPVLRSLSKGYWPVKRLNMAGHPSHPHETLSTRALNELVTWDLSALEVLSFTNFGVGHPWNLIEVIHVLSHGVWSNLRRLDLDVDRVSDAFVQLTQGKWPLLECLNIACKHEDGEFLGLLEASWPQMPGLDLEFIVCSRTGAAICDAVRDSKGVFLSVRQVLPYALRSGGLISLLPSTLGLSKLAVLENLQIGTRFSNFTMHPTVRRMLSLDRSVCHSFCEAL